MGKRIKRAWKLRTQVMACVLIIGMLASLLPGNLLQMRHATAAETEWFPGLAELEGIQSVLGDEAGSQTGFRDVEPGDWFYDAVDYVQSNGIFNGTSEGIFSPNGTMTRAMYVTALGRMAGADVSKYSGYAVSTFADVSPVSWYAPYVEWAAESGISGGTGDGKFSPDATISREQMATMLVRYFDLYQIPYETQTGEGIDTLPADLADISPWARDAVVKLWQAGLMVGDERGNFNPQKDATRAEAAVTFMRGHEVVETWQAQEQESESTDSEADGDNGDDAESGGEDNDDGNGRDDGEEGGHIGGNPGSDHSPANYTVTFESNGGTSVPSQIVRSGSSTPMTS